MRPSFRSAGSFVTLFSSLVVASAALVACGGETASLGSQGSEQGASGASGTGGTNGGGGSSAGGSNAGGNGAGGSDIVGCTTIDLTCDPDGQYKTYDANGCQQCASCPDVPPFVGDCPNGSRDVRDGATGCIVQTLCKDDVPCPEITPPHPDLCKGGIRQATTDAKGCSLAPTCQCPPEAPCGPGTQPVPRPNGACGNTCELISCPDYAPPGPEDCPSGGFVPKIAGGCVIGEECKSCPVAGDPSFCADGTIVVGIKEGQCDYGNITCLPCPASEPPVVGWCNDGAIIVKRDGKCLGAAECQCPVQGACPPNAVAVNVPGSACGAFVCNDVACPTVVAPGDITCDGRFEWQFDAKGCVSTLVCKAPG